MITRVNELLQLAEDCYARARAAGDEAARRALVREGDGHLQEADELQRGRSVVQAMFPEPGPKLG